MKHLAAIQFHRGEEPERMFSKRLLLYLIYHTSMSLHQFKNNSWIASYAAM